jgi:SAM-dependent methyltransferase
VRVSPYESTQYLNEYLLLHYGQRRDVAPFPFIPRQWLSFHQRLRQEYLLPLHSRQPRAALDLGCAVGRFTFELARVTNRALGTDLSKRFIQTARRMANRGSLEVPIKETGRQFRWRRLALPKTLRRGDVEFRVADAMDLSSFPDGAFQVVSAINLVDRLPRPRAFLSQLPRLLASGGQLLLASPFTWLEEYTAFREWIASEQVPQLLNADFRLARHGQIPFVIREHRRKFQLVVAEVFTFVRRPLRFSHGAR